MLGEYHGDAIGLHLYGVVLAVTALMRWVLYGYLMRRPELLWEPVNQRRRRLGGLLAGAPIAVYLLAMAVASAAPTVSLLLYLAVPLLYFILITVLRHSPATKAEAEDFG